MQHNLRNDTCTFAGALFIRPVNHFVGSNLNQFNLSIKNKNPHIDASYMGAVRLVPNGLPERLAFPSGNHLHKSTKTIGLSKDLSVYYALVYFALSYNRCAGSSFLFVGL
jgi:hypothetical protein